MYSTYSSSRIDSNERGVVRVAAPTYKPVSFFFYDEPRTTTVFYCRPFVMYVRSRSGTPGIVEVLYRYQPLLPLCTVIETNKRRGPPPRSSPCGMASRSLSRITHTHLPYHTYTHLFASSSLSLSLSCSLALLLSPMGVRCYIQYQCP